MTQPTYKIDQWTDAHSQGMTIGDQANAIRLRDHEASKLVRYDPPSDDIAPPVVTLTMKRWGVGGSFTAFVYCVCALAEQGAFRAAGVVLGWVVLGAVGVVVGFVIFKTCFTWTPSGSTSEEKPGSAGGGNNYYQYNNFGSNPNQNNSNSK